MLTIVFAESALEPIPEQLWQHSAVKKYAEKKGKHPRFLILDRSYHHAAMLRLGGSERKGRPDIVHFSLLEALGSPLNREGMLRLLVHTLANDVIFVDQKTRLPRNYNRFLGLMEQLFELERIPPKGPPLLTLTKNVSLPQLVRDLKPDRTIVFSQDGMPRTMEQAVSEFANKKNPLAIVGGFPHGTFSDEVMEWADYVVSVDRETLEAWTVTARIIYEYEALIGLPARRLALENKH